MSQELPALEISEREAFELSFRLFVDSVQLLAEGPEVQCERMGNYNVAWELKDDVSAGAYLCAQPLAHLSEAESSEIRSLVEALDRIPTHVLHAAGGAADNLAAMQDASWEPLRSHASRVLHMLGAAIQRNRSYFGAPEGGA